jgi:hypothetical protein
MFARHTPHLALTLMLVAVTPVGAESSGLRDQMHEQQFRELGLHKLSAPELQALEQWITEKTEAAPLRIQSATPAPATLLDPAPAQASTPNKATATTTTTAAAAVAAATDNTPEEFGFIPKPTAAEDATELHTTVLEPFSGWQGKTIFKLDNGLSVITHPVVDCSQSIQHRRILGQFVFCQLG